MHNFKYIIVADLSTLLLMTLNDYYNGYYNDSILCCDMLLYMYIQEHIAYHDSKYYHCSSQGVEYIVYVKVFLVGLN